MLCLMRIIKRPWQVLATDIFELQGKQYLLLVDYYSKFVETVQLSNLQSNTIITHLKSIFARFGIPDVLISDNAGSYASEEFKLFSQIWQFKHVTSSPLYPSSNGLAERNVQTIKKLLKKAHDNGEDPYLALLNYRNSLISQESYSPAQLLMGRRLNDRLPISKNKLKPEIPNASKVIKERTKRTEKMKRYYDRGTRPISVANSYQRLVARNLTESC